MRNKAGWVAQVTKHIVSGGVVLGEKTKALIYGGKHNLSVGKYTPAIPSKYKWVVYYTGRHASAHHVSLCLTAHDAAQEFVSFIGTEQMQRTKFIRS